MEMGTSRGRPALKRLATFPCYPNSSYIDEVLSSGHRNSRESLKEMLPFLKEEPEDSSKRQIEALLKEIGRLKQKDADSEKELKLSKANEADVTKKYKNLQLELAGFNRKAVLRELLKNFKTRRPDINRELMRSARNKFPKDFPKESLSLILFAEEELSTLRNSIDSGKFWDLMRLAYNVFPKEFPHKEFGALMRLAHDRFPKEFSREKLRNLMGSKQGLFFKEVSKEELYVLVKLGRELFSKKFPHEEFGRVMKRAHDLFPNEFPQVPVSETFTGMVTTLVNRNSTLKDEDKENKLSCLQDVAITHNWSKSIQFRGSGADFGKQFFVLCRSVPQWNDIIFHPSIEGMDRVILEQDARKGLFKVDGLDMMLFVREALHV